MTTSPTPVQRDPDLRKRDLILNVMTVLIAIDGVAIFIGLWLLNHR